MPRGPKNKFALIWYITARQKEVIETSCLIGSKKKGEFSSVMWKNDVNAKPEKYRVKITEVGSEYIIMT